MRPMQRPGAPTAVFMRPPCGRPRGTEPSGSSSRFLPKEVSTLFSSSEICETYSYLYCTTEERYASTLDAPPARRIRPLLLQGRSIRRARRGSKVEAGLCPSGRRWPAGFCFRTCVRDRTDDSAPRAPRHRRAAVTATSRSRWLSGLLRTTHRRITRPSPAKRTPSAGSHPSAVGPADARPRLGCGATAPKRSGIENAEQPRSLIRPNGAELNVDYQGQRDKPSSTVWSAMPGSTAVLEPTGCAAAPARIRSCSPPAPGRTSSTGSRMASTRST